HQDGKVLASADSPVMSQKVKLSDETIRMIKKDQQTMDLTKHTQSLEKRKKTITGIAVTDQDVFVVCPSTSDFSYTVYRLDHELKNPKLVIEGLHGCCGQMDVQASDGKLWIPHNAKHRVECRDRDGKQL